MTSRSSSTSRGWPTGLTICYDVRFPELYRILALQGAELVTVPAHFTLYTGKDHWELLLRARAVENQYYVAAAAQIGETLPGRLSYGRSLIADPWGTVVAMAPDEETVIAAELDRRRLEDVRAKLPSLASRRGRLPLANSYALGTMDIQAVLFDLDFTLAARSRPGPGGVSATRSALGLELDPSRYQEARAKAVEGLRKHSDFRHDEEIWVAFTERIIRGMGGDSDRAYRFAVEMTRAWEHAHNFDLYDDVPPVLEELRRRGLKLGIVSNTGRDVHEFLAYTSCRWTRPCRRASTARSTASDNLPGGLGRARSGGRACRDGGRFPRGRPGRRAGTRDAGIPRRPGGGLPERPIGSPTCSHSRPRLGSAAVGVRTCPEDAH